MKIQTGVDIIEVKRIQDAIERQGDVFLNKVYTKNEIDYCKNTGKMEYQHYAARFAAKEAIYKAISTRINEQDDIFNKIEIQNNEIGKPSANLDRVNISGIIDMDISLSHLKDYAMANCTILFEE